MARRKWFEHEHPRPNRRSGIENQFLQQLALVAGGERLQADGGVALGGEHPALRRALKKIQRQGWVIDDEEMEPGLRCVGAPVSDHTGRVCAAVAVSAPATRMQPERVQELIPLVLATAQRISQALGSPAHRARAA